MPAHKHSTWTAYWYVSFFVLCVWMLLIIAASLAYDLKWQGDHITLNFPAENKRMVAATYSVKLWLVAFSVLVSLLIANTIAWIFLRKPAN